MIYSPRGRWVVLGAVFLLTAIWVGYVLTVRPTHDTVTWVGGLFIVAVFALSFRAYFFLDEIQQGDRMRAWYYGAPLGLAFAGVLILYLAAEPAFLERLADIFHRRQPHKPFDYFVAGMMFTMVPQMAGNYVVRVTMALLKRST